MEHLPEDDIFEEIETKPRIEVIRERFEDLFSLNEQEKKKLSERIAQWKGKIRIVVHPFFDTYVRRHQEDFFIVEKHKATKRTENIKKVLAKMLAMEESKTPPLMIMEEFSHVDELSGEIANQMEDEKIRNHPYIIETRKDTSTPIGTGEHVGIGEGELAWRELVKVFQELGVKEILIGGMYLNIVTDSSTMSPSENNFYLRCVGSAVDRLSKDFNVELSGLTAPDSRMKLKSK